MADAIAYGHAELQKSIDLQEKLVASAGKPKKQPFVGPKADSVVKLGKRLSEGQSEFVIFDLETTAMKPENGYIVDIAALRVRDGQVVDRFESLVNPGRPIVGHQVHGINDRRRRQCADGCRGAHQASPSGSATRRSSRTTSASTCRSAAPPAERREVGADRGLRHARAGLSALPRCGRRGSSATSSDSCSVVSTSSRIARCPTRRPPPSCSSNFTCGLAERLDAIRTDIADEIRRARESYNRAEQGDRLEDIRRRHGIGSPSWTS